MAIIKNLRAYWDRLFAKKPEPQPTFSWTIPGSTPRQISMQDVLGMLQEASDKLEDVIDRQQALIEENTQLKEQLRELSTPEQKQGHYRLKKDAGAFYIDGIKRTKSPLKITLICVRENQEDVSVSISRGLFDLLFEKT